MKNQILLTLSALALFSCASNDEKHVEPTYKQKSQIAMQRVKDTKPLAKQDLVSREAMQYAMLDKMNIREDRQRREFSRIQEQQRDDFLRINSDNTAELKGLREKITDSHDILIDSNDQQNQIAMNNQKKLSQTLNTMHQDHQEFKSSFNMTLSKIKDDNAKQNAYFKSMQISNENKLAFEETKLEQERERENTIRGVVENMYADQGTALTKFYSATKEGMLPPSQWVALEDAKITLHVEDEKFEDLMVRAANNAAIHAGPWQVKWKLKKENEILLFTKFSLDAETTFGEFISNVRSYIVNYNGVVLNFRLFKEKRVLIVSDS